MLHAFTAIGNVLAKARGVPPLRVGTARAAGLEGWRQLLGSAALIPPASGGRLPHLWGSGVGAGKVLALEQQRKAGLDRQHLGAAVAGVEASTESPSLAVA